MALSAQLFTFSKKPNSTAIPIVSGTPALIELKAPTDTINLDFTIAGIPNPYVFNYCYIPEFSRYYFINTWSWDMGRWLASCKVDTLASFKSEILATTQYILRNASVFNGKIRDDFYPVLCDYEEYMDAVITNRPLTASLNTGYYIVGIVSKTGSIGAVNYYILNALAFQNLKNALFTDITWAGVSTAALDNDLLKCFMNPYDYIVSCKWCAIRTLPTLLGASSVSNINLGWWSFPITTGNAYRFNDNDNPVLSFYYSMDPIDFGIHPQSSRGIYLNQEPFAEYNVGLSPYGFIKIPTIGALYGVNFEETIDLINGAGYLTVFGKIDNDVAPLITYETDFLVDIQLAQVRSNGDWKSTLLDAGTGLASDLIGNLGDGAIKNALTGITSAVREQNTTVKVGSTNGSIGQFYRFGDFNLHVMSKFFKVTDDDPSHYGRPYCSTHLLSTLSGYTLCGSADLGITGTETEAKEIINYLNTGFYIE